MNLLETERYINFNIIIIIIIIIISTYLDVSSWVHHSMFLELQLFPQNELQLRYESYIDTIEKCDCAFYSYYRSHINI